MGGSQSRENQAKHEQHYCSILPLIVINNQNEALDQYWRKLSRISTTN